MKKFFVLSVMFLSFSCEESTSSDPILPSEDMSQDVSTADAGNNVSPDLGDLGTDLTPTEDAGPDLTPDMTFPEPDTSPMGGERPVRPILPDNYDPATQAPLLILLHGYTASAILQRAYFQLDDKLNERGFILIAPNGLRDPGGSQYWNATDYCCDLYGSGVDDVAYITGLIDEAQERFNVDPDRIYLIGHSNGGFMSYRMACEISDRLAAIVSLAGATFSDPDDCTPTAPVSVLQIHGTLDATILYGGGVGFGGRGYPGAQETVDQWIGYNGCGQTGEELEDLDLTTDLGDETQRTRWTGCEGDAAVELWRVELGSHIPTLLPAFGDAVLDFMEAHPRR